MYRRVAGQASSEGSERTSGYQEILKNNKLVNLRTSAVQVLTWYTDFEDLPSFISVGLPRIRTHIRPLSYAEVQVSAGLRP